MLASEGDYQIRSEFEGVYGIGCQCAGMAAARSCGLFLMVAKAVTSEHGHSFDFADFLVVQALQVFC